MASSGPAFVFDLDGTLVDSVYQHVIAWQRAFADLGLDIPLWRVHKRIGMSGSLLAVRVAAESGAELSEPDREKVEELHTRYYRELSPAVRPLPGARDLLVALSRADLPWLVATSGLPDEAAPQLEKLRLPTEPRLVTSEDVSDAKPGPDLFLAGAERLGVAPGDCFVVGDAVWDLLAARRAGMLPIGLLSGGNDHGELQAAHALRVYADPADMLAGLDELGIDV
jgi:HAD superfamily hydrolase (TIGR01509 family)